MAWCGGGGGRVGPRKQLSLDFLVRSLALTTCPSSCSLPVCSIKIIDFLEKKEIKLLVIGVDLKGQLLPQHTFPESLKKQEKAVYYIKAEDVTLTKENMATLLRGDMSYEIVEALAVLVEGLVVPSLSDQANVSSWPGVVSPCSFGVVFATDQKRAGAAAIWTGV